MGVAVFDADATKLVVTNKESMAIWKRKLEFLIVGFRKSHDTA